MSEQFRYFEDYQVGQKGVTIPRTVTEAHIVNFACLTSDYSRGHMDRHYAANSRMHGERVAHGLLGCSLATGMLSLDAPHIVGRGVPGAYFYSYDTNHREAIKLDDTINIQWYVADKVNDTGHEGFGQVKTSFQVVHQEGISVYDGTLTTMVKKKSAKDAELQLKPGDPWQVTEFVPNPEQVYYVEDYPIGKGGGKPTGGQSPKQISSTLPALPGIIIPKM
ncbi:MaoC/PaaZ C-terminal domain-containing protein [Chloroflexota bacterium]